MSKLLPLDGAYRVEVETASGGVTRYPKQRNGTIDVENRDHARWLRKEGLAITASATGPVAHLAGFACEQCGRRNYFKTCGACGAAEGRRE